MTAARYVTLNPVRARLVEAGGRLRWLSGAAHLAARDDDHVSVARPLNRCAGRFTDLVETEPSAEAFRCCGAAETIGVPPPRRSLTASPPSQAAICVRNGAALSAALSKVSSDDLTGQSDGFAACLMNARSWRAFLP